MTEPSDRIVLKVLAGGPESATVDIINPYLGLNPFILIEFTAEEDSLMTTVTGGGGVPQDVEEVIEGIKGVAEMIQAALDQGATLSLTPDVEDTED